MGNPFSYGEDLSLSPCLKKHNIIHIVDIVHILNILDIVDIGHIVLPRSYIHYMIPFFKGEMRYSDFSLIFSITYMAYYMDYMSYM